ncbi:hypothetical protein [Micromonospora sp. b486]|nr:hypothetical protein [Micromonospora sp. b486]MDM4784521.1 hypothetical protein [Micromonospora sp. b486]
MAIPGHDVGVRDTELPFDELVERCVAEIQERVDGPWSCTATASAARC